MLPNPSALDAGFHKRAVSFGACYLCFCGYLLGSLVVLRMLFGPSVEGWGEAEGDVSLWTLGKYLLVFLQPLAAAFNWWQGSPSPPGVAGSLPTFVIAVLWSAALGYALALWVKRTEGAA